MIKSESYKKKILLVEDEPLIGRVCQRALVAEGYDVDVVDNGQSAKEITTNNKYDLCISDIRLPGINGIQLYNHFETTNKNLVSKTIFITGDTLSKDIRAFLDKSGRLCIMKPFSPDDLIAAVKKIMELAC